MKPVFQSKFGDIGNCFNACIASLFEIPLEDLPELNLKDNEWAAPVRKYLEDNYNLSFFFSDSAFRQKGYYILTGTTTRNPKLNHAVIYKDDKLVHDPMGKDSGEILKFVDVTVFYKIFK